MQRVLFQSIGIKVQERKTNKEKNKTCCMIIWKSMDNHAQLMAQLESAGDSTINHLTPLLTIA